MAAAVQYCLLGTFKPVSAREILLDADKSVELDNSRLRAAIAAWNYGPGPVEISSSDGASMKIEPKSGGFLESPGGSTLYLKLL
jgi:hypothetical protein